ncbi:adenosylcobinamide-GDP ribazoletransferase [Oceanobacter mangrovi]|uniref:adenosylcobinamide-GDP ribazoletransferase n=1 Tax=Oceanobacter mangrovi TaxID=2862510 RepID=UPI001C8D3741|nr:adenosylcobinamide-GDP ribazoletransferase [Oceanobacter mangrovi]
MNAILSKQLNRVRLALSFTTRLPVGQQLDYSPTEMHAALVYFPLAGLLLASLLSLLFLLAQPLAGIEVTAVLLLIASLLMTGALHEDGLADSFDGFYGGFETQRKLEIMKDSRIGTYGSAALLLALLLKLMLLIQLAQQQLLIPALLIGYSLSRALAVTHAQDLPYVSAPGKSKSDPLAKPLSLPLLACLLGFGLSGLLVAMIGWSLPVVVALVVLVAVVAVRWCLKHWMHKHIQGFTGDCLGAAQQFQELWIYIVLLAVANLGYWLPVVTELPSGVAG